MYWTIDLPGWKLVSKDGVTILIVSFNYEENKYYVEAITSFVKDAKDTNGTIIREYTDSSLELLQKRLLDAIETWVAINIITTKRYKK